MAERNHHWESTETIDGEDYLHLLQFSGTSSKWSTIWGLTNTFMTGVGYFIYYFEPHYWADTYSKDVSPIHEWLLTSYATMGFGILNSLAFGWQLIMGAPSEIFTRVF